MPEPPVERKQTPVDHVPTVIKAAVTYHENMYHDPQESSKKRREL